MLTRTPRLQEREYRELAAELDRLEASSSERQRALTVRLQQAEDQAALQLVELRDRAQEVRLRAPPACLAFSPCPLLPGHLPGFDGHLLWCRGQERALGHHLCSSPVSRTRPVQVLQLESLLLEAESLAARQRSRIEQLEKGGAAAASLSGGRRGSANASGGPTGSAQGAEGLLLLGSREATQPRRRLGGGSGADVAGLLDTATSRPRKAEEGEEERGRLWGH